MNTKEETTQRHSGITGESALAIISVALAAFWIAFAYYHGGSTDGDGNRILLLHPLVPIALIVLLVRIYRYVGIKFVVHLEIIMIGLWIFVRMLGVFMPFILGFGFAYLFRFLWRALPFKKYYQRVIATVLIVVVCTSVIIFTGIAVGNQLNQMAKGLQKYFHETLIPFVDGEDFVDIMYDESDEEPILFLATNHGIYLHEITIDPETKLEKLEDRKGITNGEIIGKKIKAISVNNDYIYAGTDSGVYRCDKDIVKVVTGRTDELSETTETSPRPGFIRKIWHTLIGKREESVVALSNKLVWKKIDTEFFDTRPVKAINTPSWNSDLIYVGTANGLFFSEDAEEKWVQDKTTPFANKSIVHISSIEKYERNREDIPKSLLRKDIPMFIAAEIAAEIAVEDIDQEDNKITTVEDIDQEDSKITTVVYKLPKPSDKWERISSTINSTSDEMPIINVIVAIDKQKIELVAGTENGVYEWVESGAWKDKTDSASLPQSITMLATSKSGLYAGNDAVIHYHSNKSNTGNRVLEKWNRVLEKKSGILAYRDSEIVMQFQDYITEKIPGWTASGGAFVRWISGLAGSIAFQFGGFIATLFLAFIVFVYASQGFNKYTRGFINLVPEKHRETAMAYFREIDRNMHQFLKGQFTVIVIISILSCIIYHIIGVPFALLVGLMAGLCNAIPTFGPFIGGGFAYSAMLMGLAAGEFADPYNFLFRCLLVLGGILGIQTIDNSLISPNVMSNAVDIDPLLIMFSVIVGASILGFWGVLLAIPIIVVIKSILTVSKAAANGGDPMPTQEQS